jgi:hypothetical protein
LNKSQGNQGIKAKRTTAEREEKKKETGSYRHQERIHVLCPLSGNARAVILPPQESSDTYQLLIPLPGPASSVLYVFGDPRSLSCLYTSRSLLHTATAGHHSSLLSLTPLPNWPNPRSTAPANGQEQTNRVDRSLEAKTHDASCRSCHQYHSTTPHSRPAIPTATQCYAVQRRRVRTHPG